MRGVKFEFSFRLGIASTCMCPGVRLNVSGHDSCFAIERNAGGSWANADRQCLLQGGFIAHIDTPTLLVSLKPYMQSVGQAARAFVCEAGRPACVCRTMSSRLWSAASSATPSSA